MYKVVELENKESQFCAMCAGENKSISGLKWAHYSVERSPKLGFYLCEKHKNKVLAEQSRRLAPEGPRL